MTRYYMLECYGPDDEERAGIAEVRGADDINWMLGRRISGPITTPIDVIMDADDGIMMPMFYQRILLFSDELLAAFHSSGVDNLDLYDCVLTNPKTKTRYTDYKAANIIGLIAAADLGQSDYKAPTGTLIDVDFDSLVLDESRTRGALMFRLAECVSGIVVHENVRAEVERRGIKYLDWVDPKDWTG